MGNTYDAQIMVETWASWPTGQTTIMGDSLNLLTYNGFIDHCFPAGMTIPHGKMSIRFVSHQVSSRVANHLPSPPSCGGKTICHNSELGGSLTSIVQS